MRAGVQEDHCTRAYHLRTQGTSLLSVHACMRLTSPLHPLTATGLRDLHRGGGERVERPQTATEGAHACGCIVVDRVSPVPQDRERKVNKMVECGLSEAELLAQQEALFAQSREKFRTAQQ